jgi:hypothetical protein
MRSFLKIQIFIVQLSITLFNKGPQNTKNQILQLIFWNKKIIKSILFGRAKNIIMFFNKKENQGFFSLLKTKLNLKFWSKTETIITDLSDKALAILNTQKKQLKAFITLFFTKQQLINNLNYISALLEIKGKKFLYASYKLSLKKIKSKIDLFFLKKQYNITTQENLETYYKSTFLTVFYSIAKLVYKIDLVKAINQ